jgi:iron complex transport system substrate-binding protein
VNVAAALLWLGVAIAGAEPAPVQVLGPPAPAVVRRVVTLAPSLTDTVLALGGKDALVGVTRFDERREVQGLPRVGGFVDPSVEAVAALKPDLVLVQPSPGNRDPVQAMAGLGISILALRLSSVDDVVAGLRATALALGRAQQGEVLVQALQARRATLRERARGLPSVRVLFAYGFQPLVVAGPGSFADELLKDVGGTNVAADAGRAYPVWSVERALGARPEVVVDASDGASGRDTLQALPGLREARWVQLPSPALLHPGPALGEGLLELFVALHPEAPPEAGR